MICAVRSNGQDMQVCFARHYFHLVLLLACDTSCLHAQGMTAFCVDVTTVASPGGSLAQEPL